MEEIKELSQEAQSLLDQAKTVAANTPDEYRAVGAIYADIKNKIKLVEAERVKRTGPLNESLRLINADFKAISETLKSALLPYERAMIAYKQEEERQRRAAEEAARIERERIEAECRAKAEEERQKLAELKRQAEEAAQAQAAQEAPLSGLAAFVAEEEAAALQEEIEAARLATENAIRETAMAPRAVQVAAPPKVTAAGTSFRTVWRFKVVDLAQVPREYMILNEQMVGALARSTKGAMAIPGIEIYEEKTIGGR
jgi:hypothetical protein